MQQLKKVLFSLALLVPVVAQAANNTCASSECSAACSSGCSIPCSSGSECACPCGGKTYFATRPLYQSASPELVSDFRNDKMQLKQTPYGGAVDVVVFGGKSTNAHELGSYFMPGCKNKLTVSEQLTGAQDTTDLLAQNFNIFTQQGTAGTGGFKSTFAFCGQQTAAGLGIHVKQGFLFNEERSRWCYVDLHFPIEHIKNNFTITEQVTSDGGGVDTSANTVAVANMTQAFKQADWRYGKVNNCAHRKTGIADVELDFGYEFEYSDCAFLGAYVGVLIPTGNTPKAEYIFEPVIGHGGHVGATWGTEGVITFWHSNNEHWNAQFAMNAHAQYLFTKTQKRSFDLKNRPWSRYIQVYENQAQAQQAYDACSVMPLIGANQATPGINVFTKDVHVRPGFSVNTTAAIVVHDDRGFAGEIGYNCFGKQAECVQLACDWQETVAIKAFDGCGATNSIRTISPNEIINDSANSTAVQEYANSIIKAHDLDLNSAAHPAYFAQIVYGSAGYHFNTQGRVPMKGDIGGSYEFGNNRAVMHRWTLWGKFGLAY